MATNSRDSATDNDRPAAPDPSASSPDTQAAADLIRQKVARVYDEEPAAKQELAEAEQATSRSKHQQFMYELSNSGKDLAIVQTEWHNYYLKLPDNEKHQVWQEFYSSQSNLTGHPATKIDSPAAAQTIAKRKNQVAHPERAKPRKKHDGRGTSQVQAAIRDKVSAGGKLQAKHHLQSLLFGLGMGALVVIIFLFGFFNEVVIAPFIQPSRVAAATPLIVSSSNIAPTSSPEVIIPKINVQIPVNYSETSTDENTIENDLQDGVVHYPTTVEPGQTGNAAFFGHSSNNIFNKGKYKFAFVLLHTLVQGDTFYLTYNGKVYVYKVISRAIVEPNDVSVLNPVPGQTATATLITCDPPGTSLHRLIVVGQQISPDPTTNTTASAPTASVTPTNLPGNGPTAWTRLVDTTSGKIIVSVVLVGVFVIAIRRINRPSTSK